MSHVTLRNLEKTYPAQGTNPAFNAVKKINLEVNDHEFMVLVGPSGCGKSTTLRMIAGLEEVSSGEIHIDDTLVNAVLPKDRDISMVFQNYALYPHMSVYQNLAFALKLQKRNKAEIKERVLNAARLLEIEELLERKPKALSGGQRQRVAVGRAIVRNPKVFLFDEPLSNLDAKMRVSMRAEITKLHQRLAATMIYVTHDQTEAMTMGQRICVMNAGKIMQVDEPMTLYNHPKNLFVASFIGTPPMNLLKGSIKKTNNTLIFKENSDSKSPIQINLDPDLASKAQAYLDRPITLGVRPENISIDPNAKTNTATVDYSETLGAETHLHLKTSAHKIIVRIPPESSFENGHSLGIKATPGKIHLFDPETEEAID